MWNSPTESILFTVVPIFMGIFFVLVFGIIIIAIVNGAKQWKKNNDSPVLSVEATIVAKRTNVSYDNHDDMSSSSTTYYVTFEVESGDRMELRVKGAEYGMLAEQDKGKLTFQGTRYLGFKRT